MPSGGSKNQTVTQETKVDPQTAAARQGLLTSTQNLLGQEGPWYYPGQLVGPFAPEQLAAQNMATQQAMYNWEQNNILAGYGNDAAMYAGQYATSPTNLNTLGGAIGAVNAQMDPGQADIRSNPYLQSAMVAAARPVLDAFQTQMMPQINSGAVQAGGYGGSRQGVAQGNAAGAAATGMFDTTAQIAYDAYNRGQDRQLRAAMVAPQIANAPIQQAGMMQQVLGAAQALNQAPYADIAALNAVGQERQMYAQNLINSEIQRWMYNNEMPLEKLQLYGNIVNSTNLGSTTTTTSPSNQPSPLTQGLAGAMAGAQIGSSLFANGAFGAATTAGMATGWGAALGAGLFLLGGMF